MVARWYVIRTEPRAEHLAAEALSRDDMEVFFPRINSPRYSRNLIDLPLFPGYLFIKWDRDTAGWPTLRPVHRVTNWVRFGGVVPSIPDDVISELAKTVDAMNASNGLWRRFKVGEKVQVASGTFKGLAEVIKEAKSPSAKASVLMKFMGRMIQAQVPWVDLQPSLDQPVNPAQQIENVRGSRRTRGRGRRIRGHGLAPATAK